MSQHTRQFDGNAANFLGVDSLDATTKLTLACWMKVTDLTVNRGIMGKISASTNGFRFYLFISSGLLVGEVYNAASNNQIVANYSGILNNWVFVAFTYDTVANKSRLYFGTTPGNVAQLGSDGVALQQQGNTAGLACNLGRIAHTGFELPFKGQIHQAGAWRVALTLAELQDFAQCNTNVQRPEAIFIHHITGASPEPNDSTLTGTQGTINGTVPDVIEAVGCEVTAVPSGSVAPGALLTYPAATAGASGLNYDEGSTGAGLGVDTGFLMEPPNFNAVVHKGSGSPMRTLMGRTKGPKVAKRYFSLDHLAADLRTKRGHKR